MSVQEKLHHFQELAGKTSSIVSPRRLEQRFKLGLEAIDDEHELNFLSQTLKKFKYRQGVLNLLWKAPESLCGNERRGVVMYVGLLSRIDDIVDASLPVFERVEDMRHYLLAQSAYPNRSGYSIANAQEALLNHFAETPHKQEAIEAFFESALSSQFAVRNRLVQYGYKEALAYREATTSKYVEVGAFLADVSSENVAELLKTSMLWQRLDDAADLTDYGVTQNLYIGLAYDLGEIGVITRAKAEGLLDEDLLFVQRQDYIKMVVRETPATRLLYRQLFDQAYAELGRNVGAISAVRNLVL